MMSRQQWRRRKRPRLEAAAEKEKEAETATEKEAQAAAAEKEAEGEGGPWSRHSAYWHLTHKYYLCNHCQLTSHVSMRGLLTRVNRLGCQHLLTFGAC